MRQTEQEFAAGVFVEQRVDEAIRSIGDVDHQPLHFVVVQARHFRPGNRTVRTADSDVGIITGGRRWGDTCVKVLEHRIAEALQDQVFCQSLLKHGVRHECADFFMSVHLALQDLPNLPTITQTSYGGSTTAHVVTLADLNQQAPAASPQLIKKVLAELKREGKIRLAGRGRGASWELTI